MRSLLISCALLVLGSLALAKPAPFVAGDCTGGGTQPVGGVSELVCTPVNCPEGCKHVGITTPLGPGNICQCNYIGPQPDCCKLVHLGGGRFTTTGKCDAPGCNQTGSCTMLMYGPGGPGYVPGTPSSWWVDCPGAGGGGGDDEDGGGH